MKEENKMPKFLVKISIEQIATLYIEEEIEAESQNEADLRAEEIAQNTDITEYGYEIVSCDIYVEEI